MLVRTIVLLIFNSAGYVAHIDSMTMESCEAARSRIEWHVSHQPSNQLTTLCIRR
jgi:hypothetical protein